MSDRGLTRLDPLKIVSTAELLSRRIRERFPDSGLARLSDELVTLASHAKETSEWIEQPNMRLRALSVAVVTLIVGVSVFAVVTTVRIGRQTSGFGETMFDGVREVLDALIAREDVWLGAVTGKSRRGLEMILDGQGLTPHFLFCRTADDCPSKPHPAMVNECCDESGIAARETIVIGDAIYDMQMAKAAGATAIGVAWGYATPDELWKAGADAVVERPADLLAYIH